MILGGRDAPTPAEGMGFSIGEAIRLTLVGTSSLGDGGLVLGYRVASEDTVAPASSDALSEEG